MPIKAALQQPGGALRLVRGLRRISNAGGARYDVITHVFTTPGAITPNVTTNDRDAIFGFHAGAVAGALVAGRGSSADRLLPRMPKHHGVLPVAQGFEPNVFGEHKITNLFTVGPRLGYAWIADDSPPAAGRRPISRTPIARPSPISATAPGRPETARRATAGGMRAVASTHMVHRGALVDVVLGVEYQHLTTARRRSASTPGCAVAAVRDFDLSARGDLAARG